MTLTVDLILDTKDRGALFHCAKSLQRHIQNVKISLVDYRESRKSSADVAHYITWYIHRDSNVIAGDTQSLVTIHHISRHYSHVQGLINRKIPIVNMSTEWQKLLRRMGADADYNALVPHGVDLDFWYADPKIENSSIFTIGVVGRVYQDGRKGDHLIPQIFKYLKGREVKVILIGTGWELAVTQLRGMNIRADHYIDVDLKDLRSLIRSFSIFLSVSDVEGGPLPLLETMATGITPVSTPVGLARDLLPGQKVGYIFPKGNAFLAATLIKKLMNGEIALIDKHKLRRSAELVSWSNAAQGYFHVYHAINSGKALPSDPCQFHSAINDRRLSLLEWFSLTSYPYPTDFWTQPLLWRSLAKVTGHSQLTR